MITKKTSRWYYLPDNKWFNNRKEAKEYLGELKFREALNVRDIIFIPNN